MVVSIIAHIHNSPFCRVTKKFVTVSCTKLRWYIDNNAPRKIYINNYEIKKFFRYYGEQKKNMIKIEITKFFRYSGDKKIIYE